MSPPQISTGPTTPRTTPRPTTQPAPQPRPLPHSRSTGKPSIDDIDPNCLPRPRIRLTNRHRTTQPPQNRHRAGPFTHPHLRPPHTHRSGHSPTRAADRNIDRVHQRKKTRESFHQSLMSIPISQLRETGILGNLLELADAYTESDKCQFSLPTLELIDGMDVQSLVKHVTESYETGVKVVHPAHVESDRIATTSSSRRPSLVSEKKTQFRRTSDCAR